MGFSAKDGWCLLKVTSRNRDSVTSLFLKGSHSIIIYFLGSVSLSCSLAYVPKYSRISSAYWSWDVHIYIIFFLSFIDYPSQRQSPPPTPSTSTDIIYPPSKHTSTIIHHPSAQHHPNIHRWSIHQKNIILTSISDPSDRNITKNSLVPPIRKSLHHNWHGHLGSWFWVASLDLAHLPISITDSGIPKGMCTSFQNKIFVFTSHHHNHHCGSVLHQLQGLPSWWRAPHLPPLSKMQKQESYGC